MLAIGWLAVSLIALGAICAICATLVAFIWIDIARQEPPYFDDGDVR